MAEMAVQLVAVERRLWSGTASFVLARTTEGELGIMPGHQPLLGQLVDDGVVRIDSTDGRTVNAAVHGGFLSVTSEGVSILAETADLAEEIDIAQAKEDVRLADDTEAGRATRARAEARLKAAGQSV